MPQSVTVESNRATYSYRAADFTPCANATDVMVLQGANGKCIRLTKIGISGSATAASLLDIYITKRTVAQDSGGTSTTPTPTKYDSYDPNPAGKIFIYTANPTSFTGVPLEGDTIYLPAQATPSGEPTHWMVDYTGVESKCPILRKDYESFAINFNGQTIPAGTSLYMYMEWTEEAGA